MPLGHGDVHTIEQLNWVFPSVAVLAERGAMTTGDDLGGSIAGFRDAKPPFTWRALTLPSTPRLAANLEAPT